MTPLSLNDIVARFDIPSDDHHYYLNRQTGEIVLVTTQDFQALLMGRPVETFPESQQPRIRWAQAINTTSDYIVFPAKLDVHEWLLMEHFADALDNQEHATQLSQILLTEGEQQFLITIERLGLTEAWIAYKTNALRALARKWCELHHIPYAVDVSRSKNNVATMMTMSAY